MLVMEATLYVTPCARCATCARWTPVVELKPWEAVEHTLAVCAQCHKELTDEDRAEHAQDIEF